MIPPQALSFSLHKLPDSTHKTLVGRVNLSYSVLIGCDAFQNWGRLRVLELAQNSVGANLSAMVYGEVLKLFSEYHYFLQLSVRTGQEREKAIELEKRLENIRKQLGETFYLTKEQLKKL